MKNPQSSSCELRRIFPAFALLALASSAQAQLTWDPDNDQTNNGGAGTWDTVTSNWADDGSAPNVAWTNGSNAVFGDSGGNYQVDVSTGGVSVGDLTYEGTSILRFSADSATTTDNAMIMLSSNAAWNTGGGEIEFASGQNLDVGLDLGGNTLTVNGGGVFDAGERGNGVNWTAGNLVFSGATTLRGAAYNIGALSSVTMAGGSSFIMERNSNQNINNNWVLNGDVTFDSRFNNRTIWANGEFSGTGRLVVQGLGSAANGSAGFLRLNDVANSWSGGLTVDGSINATVVEIVGGDSVLGATPGSFDADNIILKDGGALKMNNMNLNANRGITLEGSGGVIVNRNNPNTINGAITGEGALTIGRASDGAGNATILASSANDYQGDTNVVRGTLRLGVDNATPDGSVLVIGGAAGSNSSTFDMNGFDTTIGGVTTTGGNTRQISNGGGSDSTLTIDVADGEPYVYGANFTGSDTINIVKNGAGTQTFNRSGGYSTALGDVTVNDGTLEWNNTSGATLSGTMNVGPGGILIGNGVVGGIATIEGALNPGNSPGTMTFESNLTLTSTATLTMEIGLGAFDILLNDGGDTLTADGILAFDTTGYIAEDGDTFQLFQNWGGFSGSFASITGTDLGGGLSLDTSTLLTDGIVAVVPEPTTALLCGLGLLALLRRRRA